MIDGPIQSIERTASIFRRYENFISPSYNDIKVMYPRRGLTRAEVGSGGLGGGWETVDTRRAVD